MLGLPWQGGGLTLSLADTSAKVNPPTLVNFVIVSRPLVLSHALSCLGLYGYPTCEILLVNPGYLLPSSYAVTLPSCRQDLNVAD